MDASGNWSDPLNWSAGVPNLIGDAARFLSIISAPRTVTQDVPNLVVGAMEFDNSNAYTVAGPESITLQVETGNAIISVNNSNGNGAHVISANLVLNSPMQVTQNSAADFTLSGAISGSNPIIKDGPGVLEISGADSNSFVGGITVNQGTVRLNKSGVASAMGFGSLTVGDGVGGAGADVAVLAGASQFPVGVRIVMNSSGLLDGMDNFNVVTGGMTMTSGMIVNPHLRITANITSLAHDNPAVISGGLIEFFGSTRTVTVNDGTAVNDMEINAQVSNGGLIKAGPGQLVLGGTTPNDHANGTTVNGGTLVAAKPDAFGVGSLAVNSATVQLQPGLSMAAKVTGVTTGTGGVVDMTDNDMVVDYTGTSPLTTVIKPDIVSGYANGAWNGPGINSSSAAAVTTHAVGYAEASAIFTSFPATFGGREVDNTTVLMSCTRYGDANLDGMVNLADFNRLAANFGATDAVWSQGDFNFDMIINLADFNRLAANFGLSASPDGPTAQDWANLAAAVPEPGPLALVGLAAMVLQRRRRRLENSLRELKSSAGGCD